MQTLQSHLHLVAITLVILHSVTVTPQVTFLAATILRLIHLVVIVQGHPFLDLPVLNKRRAMELLEEIHLVLHPYSITVLIAIRQNLRSAV